MHTCMVVIRTAFHEVVYLSAEKNSGLVKTIKSIWQNCMVIIMTITVPVLVPILVKFLYSSSSSFEESKIIVLVLVPVLRKAKLLFQFQF